MNSDEAPQVQSWDEMTEWLRTELADQPVGLVVEIGPRDVRALVTKEGIVVDLDYVADDQIDDEESDARQAAVCCQLYVLCGGIILVRRSRLLLDTIRFISHDPFGVPMDQWQFDDPFGDCTDGYLYTADLGIAASACTSWFRDTPNAPGLRALGMNYEMASALPGTRDDRF